MNTDGNQIVIGDPFGAISTFSIEGIKKHHQSIVEANVKVFRGNTLA